MTTQKYTLIITDGPAEGKAKKIPAKAGILRYYYLILKMI